MEKLVDLNNNEHWLLLEKLFSKIDNLKIKTILDAGSGKTSLSSLLSFFKESSIDAIIFPGDQRKKDSIELNISSQRYNLIEKDICKDMITKSYDLVLSHLLLGEAIMWGNDVTDLLDKLLSIDSRCFIIVDFLEDNTIDYDFIEQHILKKHFKIIAKETINKKEPQEFDTFIGKSYIGYLIIK